MKKILKKKRFYVFIISLFLFLLIAYFMLKKGILNIDNDSYNFIKNNLINDKITPYIKLFTNLGGALILIGVSIIIAVIIRNKKISIGIFSNLTIAFLLNELFKIIFHRERPIVDNWLINESGYSFPSGHSAVSMAFYGFLIYLIYINVKNKKIKFILISLLSIIILFVGMSRVYLGVHYISDVLAGFLFAIFYLIIFVYFYNKVIDL